jgi:hypothetical protein
MQGFQQGGVSWALLVIPIGTGWLFLQLDGHLAVSGVVCITCVPIIYVCPSQVDCITPVTSYIHQNIVHVLAGRRTVKLTMIVVDLRFL